MAETPRWLSPVNECDLCDKPLKDEDYFVDGQTRFICGPWALMCPACHETHGNGLGLGKGQKYDSEPPYLKLEG